MFNPYLLFWLCYFGLIAFNIGQLLGLPPELRRNVLEMLLHEGDDEERIPWAGMILVAMAILTIWSWFR